MREMMAARNFMASPTFRTRYACSHHARDAAQVHIGPERDRVHAAHQAGVVHCEDNVHEAGDREPGGRTRSRDSLSNDSFDEDRFLAEVHEKNHAIALFYYHVMKLELHNLYGEHEAALAAAEKAERASLAARGMYPTIRLRFIAACRSRAPRRGNT
jgi:hypothetical protein